ncbi:MAG: hypothetical protein JWQ54_2943 [Mucilaginibacter sp.]|nr:hypothetical protein [Mucilaginibacter sp.]
MRFKSHRSEKVIFVSAKQIHVLLYLLLFYKALISNKLTSNLRP